MRKELFKIGHIPAILYGEEGENVYLFLHGKHGHKEEAAFFADVACPSGFQVLGIDLPEHGERKGETGTFYPWIVLPELQKVMEFALLHWENISLTATSISAWFSMLALDPFQFNQALFISPVLDMDRLIQTMMQWAGITEGELETRKTVETNFGETLSWTYYQYVKSHPLRPWSVPTAILYAEKDNLTPIREVREFSARFGCTLTVAKNCEHWFHTQEQLQLLRQWLQEHIELGGNTFEQR